MLTEKTTAQNETSSSNFCENAPNMTLQNLQKGFYDSEIMADELETLPEPDIIPFSDELAPIEPFHFELLPDGLRPWLKDIHERVQCPPDFLAVTAMVAMASVIGRKVGIYPHSKNDWLVIPNLWGALIGRPSAMKSPAMNEVLKVLQRLVVQAEKRYKEEQAEAEAVAVLAEAKLEEAKKAIKIASAGKGAISEQQALANYAELKKLFADKVSQKRYIVNDASVEKLGALLNENDNGLLLVRDELVGWMRGMDKPEKTNDRSFYLECFNGSGVYTYDRIERGTLKIESTTLSIIGGIQPAKFTPYVSGAIAMDGNDDGFVQRFQLAVYPDDSHEWRLVDRFPSTDAKNEAYELFERLDAMQPRRVMDEWDGEAVAGLRFSNEAQPVFDNWLTHLMREVKADDTHPAIESHLLKFKSLIPSLALILELADDVEATEVSLTSLHRAIAWDNYLRSHMARIYGGVVDVNKINAQTIIKRRDKLPTPFKARELQQRGWQGLTTNKSIMDALNLLCEHGYLIEETKPTRGRPATSYYWNKKMQKG